MGNENQKNVLEIDSIIRQNPWFDFHITKYDGYNLTLVGSIDLTYFHTLEIIFEEVFFVSSFFEGWRTETSEVVIEIPIDETEKELNKKFEIQQGYQLFIIHPEDFKNRIYIAAKRIAYRTDKVNY